MNLPSSKNLFLLLSTVNIPMAGNRETPTSTFKPRDHRASTWGEWSGWLAWIRSRHRGGGTCEYSTDSIETAGLSCFVASPRDPFLHKAPRPYPTTSVENRPLKWHDPTPSRSRIRNLSRFTSSPRNCAPPSRVWSWIMCRDDPRILRPRNSGLINRCWVWMYGSNTGGQGHAVSSGILFFLRRPSLSGELTIAGTNEE